MSAIQVTNDVNNPGTSFIAIGQSKGTSGVFTPGGGTTIDLEGNSFARGGVAIYVASSNGAVAVSSRVDLWQKG